MQQNNQPFQIGLCLAGAVSAGAYTAGVIDYLIEALQEWQRRKEVKEPNTPSHDVQIPIIGGASAGGMTGLMLSSAINQPYQPVTAFPHPLNSQQTNNTLYHTWVDLVSDDMFPLMLTNSDLKPGKIESLLNASFIDGIAGRVIKPLKNKTDDLKFIHPNLKLMVTLSNLQGFDFDVAFESSDSKNKYIMTMHNDYACFELNRSNYSGGGWTPLYFFNAVNLDIAREAAMATGAFPIGLKARSVTRFTKHVIENQWLRKVFLHAPYPQTEKWTTINVDGGLINNEPFEKVQDVLLKLTEESKEDNAKLDRFKSTVIMVAPFPSEPQEFNDSPTLGTVTGNTLSAMIEQMRTKPEVMQKAWSSSHAGQYLISPSRPHPSQAGQYIYGSHAIACGALDGFSGFLNKNFRIYDFFLGRANCERFLRHHFTVEADDKHPIFAAGYANVQDKTKFTSSTDKGLQIIPIFTPESGKIPLPDFGNGSNWPAVDVNEIARFDCDLRKRLQGLVLNWDNFGPITKAFLWIGCKVILNRTLSAMALKKIKGSLIEHELIRG